MIDMPIYYDSHMHTPLCKHAIGDPVEYAKTGIKKGLKGIIMTCHSPMPDGFSADVRMAPDELSNYVQMVELAAKEMEGKIDVKLGLESDWFPGMECWLSKLHQQADFHFILGSVHPFTREYKKAFLGDDPLAFQAIYFNHLADAAESGLFDCISHADIVKVMLGDKWNFEASVPIVEKVLDRIAATGIAMELNTSGLNKSYPEMNPGERMLKMMQSVNIPVVVNSDSHKPERVGADFDMAFDLLEKVGFTDVSYFNNRERVDVLISDARQSMFFGE